MRLAGKVAIVAGAAWGGIGAAAVVVVVIIGVFIIKGSKADS